VIFPVSVFVTIVRNSASVIGTNGWPLGTGANDSEADVFVDRVLDEKVDLFTHAYSPYK